MSRDEVFFAIEIPELSGGEIFAEPFDIRNLVHRLDFGARVRIAPKNPHFARFDKVQQERAMGRDDDSALILRSKSTTNFSREG